MCGIKWYTCDKHADRPSKREGTIAKVPKHIIPFKAMSYEDIALKWLVCKGKFRSKCNQLNKLEGHRDLAMQVASASGDVLPEQVRVLSINKPTKVLE